MKNSLRILAVLGTATALSSCAVIDRFTYKPNEITSLERGSKMEIKNFFNGDIEVFAITQDNYGKIIGTFTGKMNGKWDDNKGVVQQNFSYDNGKKDSRTWLITADSDGTFSAVGHDVTAPVKGRQTGNAMQMVYSLSVKTDSGRKVVDHEDNFYLVDDRSAIGTIFLRQDGVSAGKSIVSYRKIGKSDKSEKSEKIEKIEKSEKSSEKSADKTE